MKVIIQRVSSASVVVNKETVGMINKGYLLYVCFEQNDTKEIIEKTAEKIKNLRINEDKNQKMNKNLQQVNGDILSISQFTLSWDGKKGNRPSFEKSMKPEEAKDLYHYFNSILEQDFRVEKGIFGADMKVQSINDGPVTFFLDFNDLN